MDLRRLAVLAGLLLLPAHAWAERFVNVHKGYAFETRAGWTLANPDFMITSASGASLSEAELPQGARSLDRISKTAGMIACIGADYENTDEQFDLRGDNWQGRVTVFVEPRRVNRLNRHVLQLVAQHGDEFRLFYLAVPSREWMSDRQSFTALLSALRFN